MSIAADLEQSAIRMRCLLQRGQDEIAQRSPVILGEIDTIVERVRGLEAVAVIDTEMIKAFQMKGSAYES